MISCDDCRKEFRYPCFLLKHLQRKYPCYSPVPPLRNELCQEIKEETPKSVYECEKCGKQFNTKQGKYQHKKNVKCVDDIKGYKCNDCGSIYKFRQSLYNHYKRGTCVKHLDNSSCPNFDEHSGTLYLLIEREFLKTNEPIYKVGKTINMKNRMMQYPKDSCVLFSIATEDRDLNEKTITTIFKQKFKHRSDIGSEYFEGNYKLMIKSILNLLSDY